MELDFRFSPEVAGGYLLWRATLKWQRHIKRAVQPFNITQVQFAVLASLLWLEKSEEKINQQKIADYAGIEKMMTSEVVRTLEKKNLIQRTKDKQDVRSSLIKLNPLGRSITRKALRQVLLADEEFLRPLLQDKKKFLAHLSCLIGDH